MDPSETWADLKVREWVMEGHLVVKYVKTDDNRADLFTKPLDKEPFWRHVDAIMADTSQPESPARGASDGR